MGAHPGHRGGGVLLGPGVNVGRYPVPDNKGIEAHGRKGQRYRFRFPMGKKMIPAAGANHYRRALDVRVNVRANLGAVDIQGQRKNVRGGDGYAFVQHGAGQPPSSLRVVLL